MLKQRCHRGRGLFCRLINLSVSIILLICNPLPRAAAASDASSQALAPSSAFKKEEESAIPFDKKFLDKRGQDERLAVVLEDAFAEFMKGWSLVRWDLVQGKGQDARYDERALAALVDQFNSRLDQANLSTPNRSGIHNRVVLYKGLQTVSYKGFATPYLLLHYPQYGSSPIDYLLIPLPKSAFNNDDREYREYLGWLGIQSDEQLAAFNDQNIWPTDTLPENISVSKEPEDSEWVYHRRYGMGRIIGAVDRSNHVRILFASRWKEALSIALGDEGLIRLPSPEETMNSLSSLVEDFLSNHPKDPRIASLQKLKRAFRKLGRKPLPKWQSNPSTGLLSDLVTLASLRYAEEFAKRPEKLTVDEMETLRLMLVDTKSISFKDHIKIWAALMPTDSAEGLRHFIDVTKQFSEISRRSSYQKMKKFFNGLQQINYLNETSGFDKISSYVSETLAKLELSEAARGAEGPKSMLGEGPLTEEIVGAWIGNDLRQGQLFISPDGETADWGILKEVDKGKENVVPYTPKQDKRTDVRGLQGKIKDASRYYEEIVNSIEGLTDSQRKGLLRAVRKSQVVPLRGRFMIAGHYFGHKAFAYGDRTYVPEELLRLLPPKYVAMLLVEEARHTQKDRYHVRFKHNAELLRVIRGVMSSSRHEAAMERKEAVRFGLLHSMRARAGEARYFIDIARGKSNLSSSVLKDIGIRDDHIVVYHRAGKLIGRWGYDLRMQGMPLDLLKDGEKTAGPESGRVELLVLPAAFFVKASIKPLMSGFDQFMNVSPYGDFALGASAHPEAEKAWDRLEPLLKRLYENEETKAMVRGVLLKLTLDLVSVEEAESSLTLSLDRHGARISPELMTLIHQLGRTPKGMMAPVDAAEAWSTFVEARNLEASREAVTTSPLSRLEYYEVGDNSQFAVGPDGRVWLADQAKGIDLRIRFMATDMELEMSWDESMRSAQDAIVQGDVLTAADHLEHASKLYPPSHARSMEADRYLAAMLVNIAAEAKDEQQFEQILPSYAKARQLALKEVEQAISKIDIRQIKIILKRKGHLLFSTEIDRLQRIALGAKGPNGNYMGESRFPEEMKRSWLENEWRNNWELSIRLQPGGNRPLVKMKRLVGEEMKERDLTAEEQNHFASLIKKIVKAGKYLSNSKIYVSPVSDSHVTDSGIRETAFNTEVVVLVNRLGIAGDSSAHAGTLFGDRYYAGELTLNKMNVRQVAEHWLGEATHIESQRQTGNGDPEHRTFGHRAEFSRNIDAMMIVNPPGTYGTWWPNQEARQAHKFYIHLVESRLRGLEGSRMQRVSRQGFSSYHEGLSPYVPLSSWTYPRVFADYLKSSLKVGPGDVMVFVCGMRIFRMSLDDLYRHDHMRYIFQTALTFSREGEVFVLPANAFNDPRITGLVPGISPVAITRNGVVVFEDQREIAYELRWSDATESLSVESVEFVGRSA